MIRLLEIAILLTACQSAMIWAQTDSHPETEISNGVIKARLYLPDAKTGYYRGTRFDWSGVIHSLEYAGHNYYGPWFTKTDPTIPDFLYSGADIVAGPCSSSMGPTEEFLSDESALGYDQAKAGGTFIKIGVGVLKKPDNKKYSSYRLYEIVDGGKWNVHSNAESVQFSQELADPSTGYGYVYTKTVRLIEGKSELALEHSLRNTGKRTIQTSVYNHNFLVLDKLPISSDFVISVPFEIRTDHPPKSKLARIEGKQILYQKTLQGRDTVAFPIQGFGSSPADYSIVIENKKAGAGLKITCDRPLSRESLWSIRSVIAMEPFVAISIEPGQQFDWKNTYLYYTVR